jgi:phosphoribosylglycinamide formyltransferase 1
MKKLAIFASGSGTNAENIAKYFLEKEGIATVELVLTNRRNAGVAKRMESLKIDTYYVPNDTWDNHPSQIVKLLQERNIDILILAGFMHMVDAEIVRAYRGRILNIHPSLLPAYGGKGMWGHHVHEAVIAAGEKLSGVTVHQVSEEIDKGEIVMAESVEILPEDTPETLESKIHPIEYRLYPLAIEKLIAQLDANVSPDELWADKLGLKYKPQPQISAPEETKQEETIAPPPPITEEVKEKQENKENMPPMPPNNLVWSILCMLLCCTIPGIVAVIFSAKVSSCYFAGDYEGAMKASKRAETWIIISFVLGVLSATLYLPLTLASSLLGM